MISQEKGKEVIGINDLIRLTQNVPPLEAPMGTHAYIDYNVLAHLQTLQDKNL